MIIVYQTNFSRVMPGQVGCPKTKFFLKCSSRLSTNQMPNQQQKNKG